MWFWLALVAVFGVGITKASGMASTGRFRTRNALGTDPPPFSRGHTIALVVLVSVFLVSATLFTLSLHN
jgi:hypothetical protein